MRSMVPLAAVVFLSASALHLSAAGLDNKPVDMQSIQALELRADQAQPREQCFIYAEIVHQMTELSAQQYAAGNVDNATTLLKHVQQIAHKIHLSMAEDDKRLKNAEILLARTAYRLNQLLNGSDFQDRPLVQKTLTDVTQAQDEAMMRVFRK